MYSYIYYVCRFSIVRIMWRKRIANVHATVSILTAMQLRGWTRHQRPREVTYRSILINYSLFDPPPLLCSWPLPSVTSRQFRVCVAV